MTWAAPELDVDSEDLTGRFAARRDMCFKSEWVYVPRHANATLLFGAIAWLVGCSASEAGGSGSPGGAAQAAGTAATASGGAPLGGAAGTPSPGGSGGAVIGGAGASGGAVSAGTAGQTSVGGVTNAGGMSSSDGGGGLGGGGEAPAGADTWDSYAKGFMSSYCVSCHNDDNQGATRDYHLVDTVKSEAVKIACGLAKSQQDWSARGCTGFPPAHQFPVGNGPKPSDAERDRLIAWIDAGLP